MVPQSAAGSCVPMPRKLRAADARIAPLRLSVASDHQRVDNVSQNVLPHDVNGPAPCARAADDVVEPFGPESGSTSQPGVAGDSGDAERDNHRADAWSENRHDS